MNYHPHIITLPTTLKQAFLLPVPMHCLWWLLLPNSAAEKLGQRETLWLTKAKLCAVWSLQKKPVDLALGAAQQSQLQHPLSRTY